MPRSPLSVPAAATLGLIAFAAMAFVIPPNGITLLLFSMARALVVVGLLVLLRAGLVSFGQALYFALGGYTVGFLSLHFGITDGFLRVLIGALAAAALSIGLGFLLRRYRAIFFAMLSLAFSMILYGLLVRSEALGSTDGFPVGEITWFGWRPDPAMERYVLYGIVLLFAWATCLGVDAYLRSALGRLAEAIHDNEVRVEYLGVSAEQIVHVKYVLAAALAGLSGALMALVIGHVDPNMANWTNSGEMVFVLILSGTGSIFAPFVGSIAFEIIHAGAMHYSPQAWRIILGAALLGTIMFVPGGLWSLFGRFRRPA
ncbi:branched-chain amino acid ABC transporter permease [Rhizobium chutanense]|uniref:Branched-chain amino acid ABC transporter permease n=1 Tax=Rhizobium chutanense TaxID=2035448 RepID=A0A2A6JBC0_9HYPH|nr:branched-chain amino acid ABC transporter permease [Rhizobium chutanense]PDT03241.1 branched-chain amino acid ABC transporter permease [Rhizobium chutanense]